MDQPSSIARREINTIALKISTTMTSAGLIESFCRPMMVCVTHGNMAAAGGNKNVEMRNETNYLALERK
jgi:hypothetical protein